MLDRGKFTFHVWKLRHGEAETCTAADLHPLLPALSSPQLVFRSVICSPVPVDVPDTNVQPHTGRANEGSSARQLCPQHVGRKQETIPAPIPTNKPPGSFLLPLAEDAQVFATNVYLLIRY